MVCWRVQLEPLCTFVSWFAQITSFWVHHPMHKHWKFVSGIEFIAVTMFWWVNTQYCCELHSCQVRHIKAYEIFSSVLLPSLSSKDVLSILPVRSPQCPMQPVKEVGVEPKVDMKIPVTTSEEYDINCSLCTFNSCNVVRKCTQLM